MGFFKRAFKAPFKIIKDHVKTAIDVVKNPFDFKEHVKMGRRSNKTSSHFGKRVIRSPGRLIKKKMARDPSDSDSKPVPIINMPDEEETERRSKRRRAGRRGSRTTSALTNNDSAASL
jgi:hypothetical protein